MPLLLALRDALATPDAPHARALLAAGLSLPRQNVAVVYLTGTRIARPFVLRTRVSMREG